MENLPKNIGKNLTKPPQMKFAKREKRWTFLLVGNSGKVLSFNNVQGWTIASAFVLAICITLAIILFFLYRSAVDKNESLLKALTGAREQIAPLKSDKDILMARLVIAESKIEALRGKEGKQVERSAGDSINVNVDSQKEPSDSHIQNKAEKTRSVKIEQFNVLYDQDAGDIRIEFKLTNIRQDSQPVSGFIFVVFKEDSIAQDSWLALPKVTLVSGKPSQINKGRYFIISRFTIIRFTTKIEFDPELFKRATVYVFAKKEGELLLEDDFPVAIERTTFQGY
jgi:hypothetical protein